jgi:hypothetical protein
MAQYALRIPDSLLVYARQVADEEQVSMNQFFVSAIAEKVSALKTEAWFRDNARLEDVDAYMRAVVVVQPS